MNFSCNSLVDKLDEELELKRDNRTGVYMKFTVIEKDDQGSVASILQSIE